MNFFLTISLIILWFGAFFLFAHDTHRRKALQPMPVVGMILFTFVAPFLFLMFSGVLALPPTVKSAPQFAPPLTREGKIADDAFAAHERCMKRASIQTSNVCLRILQKAELDILDGTEPINQ